MDPATTEAVCAGWQQESWHHAPHEQQSSKWCFRRMTVQEERRCLCLWWDVTTHFCSGCCMMGCC